MASKSIRFYLTATILTWLLTGCATPYALKTSDLDYERPQAGGTITVSDPKLYRREALINERRRETDYLDGLINDSKTQVFTPEIISDLEVITSLSAAIGVRFDPASALNFNRQAQTSGIQQDIDALKLQLQLEQLKRDAELVRAGLPAQTTPVNGDLGKLNGAPAQAVQSNVSAASAEQLVKAINSLQTSLATRLDTTPSAPKLSTAGVNPIDAFQDRAAYRALLNSARDAASLDELHDKDGSALVRLSFSATVLPPTKTYIKSLGVVRMSVQAPNWRSPGVVEGVYSTWLSYINRALNAWDENAGQFRQRPTVAGLAASGELFDTVYYLYPTERGAVCDGLSFKPVIPGSKCSQLYLAAPRIAQSAGSPAGPYSSIESVYRDLMLARAHGHSDREADPQVVARLALRHGDTRLLGRLCEMAMGSPDTQRTDPATQASMDEIEAAASAKFVAQTLSELELQARKTLLDQRLSLAGSSTQLSQISATAASTGLLLADVNEYGFKGCDKSLADIVQAYVPPRFHKIITDPGAHVAIYDVSPREQVQQVSTTARAADAIGLAAALSGQIPSSGFGADGNIAYSRSATGKADARDRAPLVVSFAEARDSEVTPAAFGWLLGPRVTLDPRKQALVLEHQVKPYELSADLSVPGWWPYFGLFTQTAWSPDWRSTTGAILNGRAAATRTVKVSMTPNPSDLAALTGLLSGDSSMRLAFISSVTPTLVSPCADTQLQIEGENIWRASEVVIGGRLFGVDKVSVLPDMGGVLVKVDAGAYPSVEAGNVKITVLTPYGPATGAIALRSFKDEDGSCQPRAEPTRLESTGPAVIDIRPAEFSVCADKPVFTVTGARLKEVVGATLGGVDGKIAQVDAKNGSTIQVTFSGPQIRSSFAGLQRAVLALRSAKGSVGEMDISIVTPSSCPK